jgi:hypothetical protein
LHEYFGLEKGPLDVFLLWLVLYVVALPIGDGCDLLIRDPMRFIKYFLLSNLVQKVILKTSLQRLFLALTMLYLFT